ncbi:uncharacterized protein LOC141651505 [Silene latifolia]|uniref:uncharacterized protein LOC141651505 n=1 Tax=Silene latifolia TaxID=37657 RepID=UPI003D76AD97
MNSIYKERGHDQFTIEEHYRRNSFYAAIDKQLHELRYKFNEKSVELLTLSYALEPRSSGQRFNIGDICDLVKKFYPEDFTEVENEELRVQLLKHNIYPLHFRLAKLLLTLPVSTTSAERAFSAVNVVKTTRHNKMEADYLESCLLIDIEREIANQISTSSIIDTFTDLKERQALF